MKSHVQPSSTWQPEPRGKRGWAGEGQGTRSEKTLGLLLPLEMVNQGGLEVPFQRRGVLMQQGLAQHLVPVEHCLPLLLHLPLPALLRPLHPLQHCVGPGTSQGGHCGQGVSVLQGKEWGWRPGSAQPEHRGRQLTWGETAPERAVQGLSCSDEKPPFQSSSTPVPKSLLLGITHNSR